MKGISVLIPVFNYSLQPLVSQLLEQAKKTSIPVEIICFDDASSNKKIQENNRVFCAKNPSVKYQEMLQNKGRAVVRNLLADAAQYEYILFIDVDSLLPSSHFLENYIQAIQTNTVVAGGTCYGNNYAPSEILRYRYGKVREEIAPVIRQKNPYRSITLNNLFIPLSVFKSIRLDDAIATYGHEDTKFGYGLQALKIPVLHIQNPVEHTGLETSEVFLQKTQEGVRNFVAITQQGFGHDSKLYKTVRFLQKWRLVFLVKASLGCFCSMFRKNLLSQQPSLFYFDLYKLYFFLIYTEKND